MDNKETRRTELAYIRQLKSEYDLNNPREVLAVFRELQTNGFKFTTKEGIEFDDEIFERAQEYKHQGYRESSPSKGTIVRDQVYEKDLEIEVRRQLQKRERIRRTIVISCLSTAVICIGVFLYYYYVAERTQREYEQLAEMIDEDAPTGAVSEITNSQMVVAEDGTIETVTLSVLDKYEELYHTNPNLIGWLKIGDTVIDYPVTQTSESDYYLNHNFYGKTDSNGCIFMDPDCNVIDRSDNLILYGHHMKSGNMFGNLDRYSKYEYYLNIRPFSSTRFMKKEPIRSCTYSAPGSITKTK